jgi:hypothetical protein
MQGGKQYDVSKKKKSLKEYEKNIQKEQE